MARLPPPLRRLVARAQLGVLPQQPGALQPHADGQVLGVTAVAALRHRAVGEGQLEDDQAEPREVLPRHRLRSARCGGGADGADGARITGR
eukprot:scaffold48808_cov57-Phaeocystis_antarctica.AAC.1